MPNCEIISGGVNNAEKTKIPKKKYFLFFLKNSTSTIPNFVKIIKRIGNSNDIPHANNKNSVNFIYSEYLDSSSKLRPEEKKFSNEIKKDQIKGIKTKYAKAIPKKNKIGTKKKIGIKIFFSFLYIAGDKKSTIWTIKKGIEIIKDANNDIFRFETKTSGNPVKIILFSSESTSNLNKGLERSSPKWEAL